MDLLEIVWVARLSLTAERPLFFGADRLPSGSETCHDARMSKTRRLLDVYRFPGFEPCARVHGIFGDPYAVVIPLRRRRKKLGWQK